MRGLAYEWTKRLGDCLLACLGLLLLAPVLMVIAVLVWLSSPGPVLYRGVRTGRFGRPFRILKFRTMVANAEQLGGVTTGKNDPRLTTVGATLRKYKLDELPQLFNVLAGDMSFVGPRPEVAQYTDLYRGEELKILRVRPGITDWSSLEFSDLQEHVGEEDPDRVFRERVLTRKNQLRLLYAENCSLVTDLMILLKTIAVVLGKPFRGLVR